MSNTMHWLIALLGLLALVLIGWSLADNDSSRFQVSVNTAQPTYQSEYTTTVVYNLTGELNYKLEAYHVNHFNKQKITWFTRPVATMFDKNKVPSWILKADKAKLTEDRILYMYGHVQVDSLNDVSQIKRIRTNNAVVNLVTQDIFSDDEITLSGNGFNSTGMKMRGNLHNKTAELIEKVRTFYDIQDAQCTP